MTTRRVVFAHDTNAYGGMEVHVELMLSRLDRDRYEPAVYVPGFTEAEWSSPQRFLDAVERLGVPILRPPHPGHRVGVSFARNTIAIARLLRSYGADIVHVHTNVPNRPKAVHLAARLAGVPCVVRSEHLPPSHFGVDRSTKVTARGLAAISDAVVVGSESCRIEQIDLLGRSARLVRLLEYGIDTSRFDPDTNPVVAKRALGFDPEIPIVGAIGRLAPLKGHRYLIDAVPRIIEAVGAVRVVIVGDGALRRELAAQVAALGLIDVVTFAGYQADTAPYIAAMDVATMPTSIDEGVSLAMLEFMAMRRPVVATDDPSFGETIVNGESGLIVPKGESEPLADAIISLLLDRRHAESIAAAGRRVVVERFDVQRQAEGLMDLYDELLDGSPRRASVRALDPTVVIPVAHAATCLLSIAQGGGNTPT